MVTFFPYASYENEQVRLLYIRILFISMEGDLLPLSVRESPNTIKRFEHDRSCLLPAGAARTPERRSASSVKWSMFRGRLGCEAGERLGLK